MTHHRAPWPGAGASGRRGLRLAPMMLGSLLILFLLVIPACGVSASSSHPAPVAQGARDTGTTLAMVRAGGAALYDDSGAVIAELPSGTTLKISGRTSDNRWFYGAAKDGPAGWTRSTGIVIFGVNNVAVRNGPRIEPAAASPTAQPAPAPAADDAGGSRKPAAAGGQSKASPTGLSGKLVFQERSGGKIYVYDLAGGTLRQLTTGADPAVSPDGSTVVFWRDTGEQGLYLIGIDGAGERRILTRGELLRSPAWSPDGQKIVFSHVTGENRCRYAGYIICFPDKFPYNLPAPYGLPLITNDSWSLARVDREGGSYQDLATQPNAITPSWGAHGILYGSSADFFGGAGIHLTQDAVANENAGGEGQARAVAGEFRYHDPAGQIGGDRVVFQSQEKDHWEIFAVNVDGSGLAALTHPDPLASPLPHNVSPAWSPDGRNVVFLSNRTGQWRLWVMGADGSNQRQLPVDVPIEYNYQAEQVVSWGR